MPLPAPRRPSRFLRLCAAAALWSPSAGWAADERAAVPKTKEGLHFTLPPDWPVEKRGGIVAPIPVEEYLAKKFKAIDEQFSAMDERFKALAQQVAGLERQLQHLEQRVGTLSSQAAAPPAAPVAP